MTSVGSNFLCGKIALLCNFVSYN